MYKRLLIRSLFLISLLSLEITSYAQTRPLDLPFKANIVKNILPDQFSREIYIYLNQDDFNEENLTQLLSKIDESFLNPVSITVFVSSNLETLEFESRHPYPEDSPKTNIPVSKGAIFYRNNYRKYFVFDLPSEVRGLGIVTLEDRNINKTNLVELIKNGYTKEVKNLLDIGTDVNTTDSTRKTPLMWAVYTFHNNYANLLIRKRASINAKDENGVDALLFACYVDNLEGVEILLKAGADPNSTDIEGNTSLMWADKSKKIFQILINAKVDINAKNKEGRTALFQAVATGNIDKLEFLLKNGADSNIYDRNGVSAVSILKSQKIDKNIYNKILDILK